MKKSKNALSDEELEQVTGGAGKTTDIDNIIDNTNISYDIQWRNEETEPETKIIEAIDCLADENNYILPR